MQRIFCFGLIAVILLVSGCVQPIEKGGEGTLTLKITDKQVEGLKSLNITISSIEVHNDGNWIPFLSKEFSVDLMKLNGVAELIGSEKLPAGKYTQIRLRVERADLELSDGNKAEVKVPSEKINIINEFNIDENKTTELILDFNPESVKKAGEKYVMAPVIKVLPLEEFNKKCASQKGFICEDDTICPGTTVNAIDSNICCSVECKEKPKEETFISKIEIKDLNSGPLPIWTKGNEQYEYLSEIEWFRVLLSVHDEKRLANGVKIEIYAFDISDGNRVSYTPFPEQITYIFNKEERIYQGNPINPLKQQDFNESFAMPNIALNKDSLDNNKNQLGFVTPLIFVISLLNGETVISKATKEIKFHNYPFTEQDVIVNAEEKTKYMAELLNGHIEITATEPRAIEGIIFRYCKLGYDPANGVPCSNEQTYEEFRKFTYTDFNFVGNKASFDYKHQSMFAQSGKWWLILEILFNTRIEPIYITKELDIKWKDISQGPTT